MASKTTDQIITDARAAARLKDDGDLSRFLVEMEAEIFEAFRAANAGNTTELIMLHAQLAGVDALRIKLQSLIDGGAVAQRKG